MITITLQIIPPGEPSEEHHPSAHSLWRIRSKDGAVVEDTYLQEGAPAKQAAAEAGEMVLRSIVRFLPQYEDES